MREDVIVKVGGSTRQIILLLQVEGHYGTRYEHSTKSIGKQLNEYLYQAHDHYGKCLGILQEELSAIDEDNADAALACSVSLITSRLPY